MVLVCDDTMSIRRLLRINLELEGFEVIEACDGAAALLVLQGLHGSGRLPGAIVLGAQVSLKDHHGFRCPPGDGDAGHPRLRAETF